MAWLQIRFHRKQPDPLDLHAGCIGRARPSAALSTHLISPYEISIGLRSQVGDWRPVTEVRDCRG